MTARERILVLADNGVEAHVIAALLNLEVGDVVLTLADPTHEPSPSGGGPERLTEGNGPPTEGTHPAGWLYFDREHGTLYVSIVPPPWDERVTFRAGAVVGVEGVAYRSLGENLGAEPPSTPGDWEPLDHYSQWDCLGGQAHFSGEGLKREGNGLALADDREVSLYTGMQASLELADYGTPRLSLILDGLEWRWWGSDQGPATAGGMQLPSGSRLFNTSVEPEEAQGEDGDFALGRDGKVYAKQAGVWKTITSGGAGEDTDFTEEGGLMFPLSGSTLFMPVNLAELEELSGAKTNDLALVPDQANGEPPALWWRNAEGWRKVGAAAAEDADLYRWYAGDIVRSGLGRDMRVWFSKRDDNHEHTLDDEEWWGRLGTAFFPLWESGRTWWAWEGVRDADGVLYVALENVAHEQAEPSANPAFFRIWPAEMIAWDAGRETKLWEVNTAGYEISHTLPAPADADIQPGQVFSFFDDTPGACKFIRRGRDSEGKIVQTVANLT